MVGIVDVKARNAICANYVRYAVESAIYQMRNRAVKPSEASERIDATARNCTTTRVPSTTEQRACYSPNESRRVIK